MPYFDFNIGDFVKVYDICHKPHFAKIVKFISINKIDKVEIFLLKNKYIIICKREDLLLATDGDMMLTMLEQ